MPVSSYQEMASASNWYPCPPSFLPFGFITLGDLQQISHCYRGLTLQEAPAVIDPPSGVQFTRERLMQTTARQGRLVQSTLRSAGLTLGRSQQERLVAV